MRLDHMPAPVMGTFPETDQPGVGVGAVPSPLADDPGAVVAVAVGRNIDGKHVALVAFLSPDEALTLATRIMIAAADAEEMRAAR